MKTPTKEKDRVVIPLFPEAGIFVYMIATGLGLILWSNGFDFPTGLAAGAASFGALKLLIYAFRLLCFAILAARHVPVVLQVEARQQAGQQKEDGATRY